MYARDLVELGALVALHGAAFIRGAEPISERGLQRYWLASKCRLDRWHGALKSLNLQIQDANDKQRRPLWQSVRPVLEEILAGELLTRVWTAVATAYDQQRAINCAEPIVRSVLIGHLEARHRALNMIVHGQGFGLEEAVALNQLRRTCERWTDVLLAHLIVDHDIGEFAFDPVRALDFAADLRDQQQQPSGCLSSELLLASLRAAFQKRLSTASPNCDLNQRLAASILSCFRTDQFDSTGLFKSLWLVRLDNTAKDAERMIRELLDQGPVHG
jgi:hypothetical protein